MDNIFDKVEIEASANNINPGAMRIVRLALYARKSRYVPRSIAKGMRNIAAYAVLLRVCFRIVFLGIDLARALFLAERKADKG